MLSTHRVLFWPVAQTALQGQQYYSILLNDSCKVWGAEMTCSHPWQEGNQSFSWDAGPFAFSDRSPCPSCTSHSTTMLRFYVWSSKAHKMNESWYDYFTNDCWNCWWITDTLCKVQKTRQAFSIHSSCLGIRVLCSVLDSLHAAFLWILAASLSTTLRSYTQIIFGEHKCLALHFGSVPMLKYIIMIIPSFIFPLLSYLPLQPSSASSLA